MKRLFLALALVTVSTVPVPAHAAGCDGVTVVVDFRGLGGGVQQGCAAGAPASGVAALSAAGFGYTYAARQPGFVCRINGKPGTAADPCVNASPTTAYWSYWHAQPGGSWSYSNEGAATYKPAKGSVEGWSFGGGQQPGIAPPAAPVPPQQPKPPAPQPPPVQQPPAQQPPGQQPPAVTTTTQPPTSSSAAPVSSESAPSSAVSSSSVQVQAVEQKSQQIEEKSGLGWLWTLLGVLVIAGLAAFGIVTARRRRITDE